MNTELCPIIKLVNQRLQDLQDNLLGGQLSEEQNEAYMALCNAKFHLVRARALLQEQDVKRQAVGE